MMLIDISQNIVYLNVFHGNTNDLFDVIVVNFTSIVLLIA